MPRKPSPFKIELIPTPSETTELLNHKELAKLLRLSERTLYRRVARLKIPKFKIGTRVLYDANEVIEHLRRMRNKREIELTGDDTSHLKDLMDVLSDKELAGPLRLKADSVVLNPSAAHVFQFGRADIRFPRMSYEIVHIDEVHNEVGLWIGVTILLDALLVDTYKLREYVV